MDFQQAHLISTIKTLFRDDERLLYFFFDHKEPELRVGPGALLEEARSLSSGEYVLIQAALAFWTESRHFNLHRALGTLDDENIVAFVKAILHWREISVGRLLCECVCRI